MLGIKKTTNPWQGLLTAIDTQGTIMLLLLLLSFMTIMITFTVMSCLSIPSTVNLFRRQSITAAFAVEPCTPWSDPVWAASWQQQGEFGHIQHALQPFTHKSMLNKKQDTT
jgi:hypothetical protein